MKNIRKLFALGALLALLLAGLPTYSASAAGTKYVKPGGSGDCSSWANACDLQTALTGANSGDQVWVAAGTYKPTTGTDRLISFELKNGVAVYGGFAGSEVLATQRNPSTNITILSGDIGTLGGPTDNSSHVVIANGVSDTTILDGFTITGGYAVLAYPYDSGGGLYNNGGSPILKNIIFSGNFASYGGGMFNEGGGNPSLINVTFGNNSGFSDGGGMYNLNSNPTLSNSTFNENFSYDDGGGMYNIGSSPSLEDVDFNSNGAAGGGGIYNGQGSSPSLTNVTFQNNTAVDGGGMSNISSNPTLTNVIFSNNSATAYGDSYGGGMSNQASNPILTNVSFNANSAKKGGGMFNYHNSSPILNNVTFSGNTATTGGGMYNWRESNPSITNATFSGNTATSSGGGIHNERNSYPVLTNTTFNSNSAWKGGGIHDNSNSSSTIRNSILYINYGGQIYNANIVTIVTYSIVYGGYPGEGNLDADPLLDPLQNNGGFTETMALGAGSPAIDAGDDGVCPATDQRGVTRPQGSHCDIGAFEVEIPPIATTLTSPSGDIGEDYTPTYTWDEVYKSTWYYLWVNDAANKAVIKKWYEASEICDEGVCDVTPATTLGGGDFTWWVRTWNTAGYGPWSAGMDFHTYVVTAPGKPVLHAPTGDIGETYNPTYQWDKVTESGTESAATWYYLWVNGPNGKAIIKQWYQAMDVCSGSTCSVTPDTTLGGGQHTWWVQAWNAAGTGPWSDSMTFSTTIPTAPIAATLVSPSGSGGANPPVYTWNQVSNATWYYVWVDGSSGTVLKQWYTSAQANCGIDTCSVTQPSALPDGSYKWWVRTWNSVGYGPWSSEMDFSLP